MNRLYPALASLALLPILTANYVPPSSIQELTSRSDVVIGAIVTRLRIPIESPPTRIWKNDRGEMVIENGWAGPCFRATVRRIVKGRPEGTILVCRSAAAELRPKEPVRDGLYNMYLRRVGKGLYVPVSWDALRPDAD